MRSSIRARLLGGALCALAFAGCGDDRVERGIATEPEVAVPEDPRELEQTEMQRQAETQRGIAVPEREAFDAAEEGRKEGEVH